MFDFDDKKEFSLVDKYNNQKTEESLLDKYSKDKEESLISSYLQNEKEEDPYTSNHLASNPLNIRGENYGNMSVIDKMRGIQAGRLNIETDNASLAEGYVDKALDRRVMNGLYNYTLTDLYTDKSRFMAVHGLYADGIVDIVEDENSQSGAFEKQDKNFSLVSDIAERDIKQREGKKETLNALKKSSSKKDDKEKPSSASSLFSDEEYSMFSEPSKKVNIKDLDNQGLSDAFSVENLESNSKSYFNINLSEIEGLKGKNPKFHISEDKIYKALILNMADLELLSSSSASRITKEILANLEKELLINGISITVIRRIFNTKPLLIEVLSIRNFSALKRDLIEIIRRNKNYFSKKELMELGVTKDVSSSITSKEKPGFSEKVKNSKKIDSLAENFKKMAQKSGIDAELDMSRLNKDLEGIINLEKTLVSKDVEQIAKKIAKHKLSDDTKSILKNIDKNKINTVSELDGIFSQDIDFDELEKSFEKKENLKKPKKEKKTTKKKRNVDLKNIL